MASTGQPHSSSFFGARVPSGFAYRPQFMDGAEELALLEQIARVAFATFEMRGVAARRRVAFFGDAYRAGVESRPALPSFLTALRDKVAAWAEMKPEAFVMALINEYPVDAPIGWHRDAPQYEAGECRCCRPA